MFSSNGSAEDGGLTLAIVGRPDSAADHALARWFEEWLQRQHPGTAWRVPVEDADEGLRRPIGGAA